MKKINVLIVDDLLPSKNIIHRGIQKFNSEEKNFQLHIISETDSVEQGIKIIEQQIEEPIQLVFLNHHVSENGGIDLSRKYPSLAYLFVSSHPYTIRILTGEKQRNQYFYMEHISEGCAFTSEDVLLAIQQYLSICQK